MYKSKLSHEEIEIRKKEVKDVKEEEEEDRNIRMRK